MASGILVEHFNFPVFEFLEAESGVGFQRLLCNGRTPQRGTTLLWRPRKKAIISLSRSLQSSFSPKNRGQRSSNQQPRRLISGVSSSITIAPASREMTASMNLEPLSPRLLQGHRAEKPYGSPLSKIAEAWRIIKSSRLEDSVA